MMVMVMLSCEIQVVLIPDFSDSCSPPCLMERFSQVFYSVFPSIFHLSGSYIYIFMNNPGLSMPRHVTLCPFLH